MAISFVFISCFSDDDLKDNLEVYVDAYVIKKNIGDVTSYAPAFFAYGNQLLRSVTVTEIGGSGETIDLTQDFTSILTMSKRPDNNDFLPYPPAASDYLFEVTAESGVTVEEYDFLAYSDMGIPTVTQAEFTNNNKLLEVAWSDVAGADGYMVKILNSEGTEISAGSGFEAGTNSYTINIVLENWYEAPEPGQTYSVQVHAFAYEAEFEPGYEVYNVQEVSIGETTIVWP